MPKKIAVFVEGLTEQEFTIQLLTEIAGIRGINFEIKKQHGGTLSFVEMRSSPANPPQPASIYVLVVNCCTDNQVKTQIRDQYNSLSTAGYSLIVGLRDIYPFQHHEIQDIEAALPIGLPTGNLPIRMHLAVLEIEAWFLEELTHFEKIHSTITGDTLINNGFDYRTTRAHTLPHPSETLDNIYKAGGARYQKKRRQIQKTVTALSYEELYVNARQKAPSLDSFISSLEAGLFPS